MTDKDKIEEALRNAPNGVEPRADLADDAAALAQKLYADKPKKTKKMEARNRLFLFGCVCFRGCVCARILSLTAPKARHTLLYRRRFDNGGSGERRFDCIRKQFKCEILSRRAENLY